MFYQDEKSGTAVPVTVQQLLFQTISMFIRYQFSAVKCDDDLFMRVHPLRTNRISWFFRTAALFEEISRWIYVDGQVLARRKANQVTLTCV
jgi:hypothetical protein